MMWRATVVVALLAVSCGCEGDTPKRGAVAPAELEFEGRQAFLPGFEHDTGWLPGGAPVSVRIVATGTGGITVRAHATTDGASLTPLAGTGELASDGGLVLKVSAKIDTSGVEFEDVVDTFEYAIDPGMKNFDPFLLDAGATVRSKLPEGELARVPIPGAPAAKLRVDVAGGAITTAFAGTCAKAAERVGQYTGVVTTSGTVDLEATLEIDALLDTVSFGPFPVPVKIPKREHAIDLGTLSLETGQPVDAPRPCEDTAPDDNADGDDESSGPADSPGGTTTLEPTDPGSTGGPTMESDSASGDTAAGYEPCGPDDECNVLVGCDAGEACSHVCSCYDVEACDTCVMKAHGSSGACEDEATICLDNTNCAALLGCISLCFLNRRCVGECLDHHPAGGDDFDALQVCLLGDDGVSGACGSVCA